VENWKDVISYESLYQVSDMGRVRSFGGTRPGLLKGDIGYNGYQRVTLWQNGKPEKFSVHKLVMIMFVGVAPDGYEINHKNGKRADNRLENLEYVTHSQNLKYSYDVLGIPRMRGTKNGHAVLTDEKVRQIRILARTGYTHAKIAEIFGICRTAVTLINQKKRWKHISE